MSLPADPADVNVAALVDLATSCSTRAPTTRGSPPTRRVTRRIDEPLPRREDAARLRTVVDLCVDELETLA
ncbi:MAG: hypothetical protein WCD11_28320 [Solirubrobacteraceae bacterium]